MRQGHVIDHDIGFLLNEKFLNLDVRERHIRARGPQARCSRSRPSNGPLPMAFENGLMSIHRPIRTPARRCGADASFVRLQRLPYTRLEGCGESVAKLESEIMSTLTV
jgi:hypothetical protein